MLLRVLAFVKLLTNSIVIFFDSSDLDSFKTQSVRSAVNVREGQGVVLLCGAPPHSGGKRCHIKLLLFVYFCFDCRNTQRTFPVLL